MSNPEQPTTPETPNTPDATAAGTPQPTSLPPASELPESAPLASEPLAPAATQVLPPLDPNAATQAFPAADPAAPAYPGAPEAPAYGAPVPPAGPGAPYGVAPQPGGQAPMNTLAIVAFIGSFFIGLVGIICGHISLKQIKRDGTRGRGFALAGTIIGYVNTAAWIIGVILLIVASIAAAGLANSAQTELEKQLESQLGDTSSEIEEAPDSSAGGAADGEFCAVLEEVQTVEPGDPAAESEAFQMLADASVDPKNRELIAKLAQAALDPAAAELDPNFATTLEEGFTALAAETLACN